MSYNQEQQPKSALSIALLIFALIVGISMIGAAWWISSPRPETESEIRVRQEAELVRQREALRQRRELLSRQIQNLVGTEEEANRVAILRAKSSLDDAFTLFSNRVPQFAEEITTWKSRYQITRSGLKDKIHGSHELEALASEYFEKHVASNQDISSAIDKITAQFQSDLVANRKVEAAAVEARRRWGESIAAAKGSSTQQIERISAKFMDVKANVFEYIYR